MTNSVDYVVVCR